MELTLKRKRCKPSFEREGLASVQGVPDSEVTAVIDKVEAAADHFKYAKCFKRCICLYFLVLLLCVAGFAIRHHIHHRRHMQGWKGPLSHMQRDGPAHHGRPHHFGPQTAPADGIKGEYPRAGPCPRRNGKNFPAEVKPELPEEPEIPQPADQPIEGSAPRKLQGVDSAPSLPVEPSTTAPGAPAVQPTIAPAVDPAVNPSLGAPDAQTPPGFPGVATSSPAQPPYWRHHGRHRGHGPRGPHHGRHHAQGRGPHGRHHGIMGRAKWFKPHWRHHKRGCAGKFIVFFLVIPLLMFLGFRCAKKRVARRVRKILDIENRRFREKFGCEWSVNWHVTKLTLRRLAFPQQAPLGYPVQPVYPQPSERTPFCHQQADAAPLFAEHAPQHLHHHQHHGPKGYQRVSLDDSSINYQ